jgi:hypothetical protein
MHPGFDRVHRAQPHFFKRVVIQLATIVVAHEPLSQNTRSSQLTYGRVGYQAARAQAALVSRHIPRTDPDAIKPAPTRLVAFPLQPGWPCVDALVLADVAKFSTIRRRGVPDGGRARGGGGPWAPVEQVRPGRPCLSSMAAVARATRSRASHSRRSHTQQY